MKVAVKDNTPRVGSSISYEEFMKEFEVPNKPVVIRNLAEGWKEQWSMGKLVEEFGEREFKVGMDDDGNRVTLPLRVFEAYVKKNQDLNPLYLFDG